MATKLADRREPRAQTNKLTITWPQPIDKIALCARVQLVRFELGRRVVINWRRSNKLKSTDRLTNDDFASIRRRRRIN